MSRSSESPKAFLQSGIILTAVTFIASAIHYLFQSFMGHLLPREEYGYMNSTLGVILLLSVPLVAASQSVAHFLARLQKEGDAQKLEEFRQKSLHWLWKGTWILLGLALLSWKPMKEWLNFPRTSLALLVLACLPAQLWSVVASAWCAGSGRFRLLGGLTLGGALMRLGAGIALAYYWRQAESGIAASLLGALAIGALLFFVKREKNNSAKTFKFPTGFFPFLGASVAVGIGNFLFLQADQIVAQRFFSGMDLGNYSAAGVLGRAVVLGSLPFLTVYFTQRSEITASNRQSWGLKFLYGSSLLVGSSCVYFMSDFLCRLLLGHREPQTTVWMDQFAVNMAIVGVLNAIGFFLLASRRFIECFCYGVLGLIYTGFLLQKGITPDHMLEVMRLMTGIALGMMVALILVRDYFKKKSRISHSLRP